jgi:hypothetical protein
MSYGWITGAPNQTPIAPDTQQAMRRSPFATARRRREQSVRFKKLVAMSRAREEAARGAENNSGQIDA